MLQSLCCLGNSDNITMEAETAAVVNWTLTRPFSLSVNLQAGSLVVAYPFDSPTLHGKDHSDSVYNYVE